AGAPGALEEDDLREQRLGLVDRARTNRGLILAPFGILALAGVLVWYYQYLDLENNQIQIRSALDWDTKLYPQIKRHLDITIRSTIAVVLIAIPLGIALTRPALRKAAPYFLAIANSGQALPAYGLLVLFLLWLGQGATTVVWALTLFAILPVLRNTMVGLDGVDLEGIPAEDVANEYLKEIGLL
ncbi:MAG: hypothetical protein AAGK32_20905, partial [Actinomycetota bacterium]